MPAFDPAELQGREGYFLLTGLIVPRPIAWVSTLAADGTRNLAPHSYCNVISADPPIVHFTSTGVKDTLRNVRATGEFVLNVVDRDLVEAMNLTAADFPPEVDELAWAGLDALPSDVVAPPRVAAAPAALECTVRATLSMGDGTMVFGDVRRIHVADALWVDGRVRGLRAVGRLSGSSYVAVEDVFTLPRPSWAELREEGPVTGRGAEEAD